jgi:hypothetical protein
MCPVSCCIAIDGPIDSSCFFSVAIWIYMQWKFCGVLAWLHFIRSMLAQNQCTRAFPAPCAFQYISEENRCPGCCLTHFISVLWDAVGFSAGCFIANNQPPEWTFAHFQWCKFPRVPSGAWSDALAITLTDLIAIYHLQFFLSLK